MTSGQRRGAIDDRTSSRRRRTKAEKRKKGSSSDGTCSSVSDKLIALKSLIPTQDQDREIVKAEQLFQETANYIVRLKAQVFVLQRLVDLYGSNQEEDQIDAVL
ncbi:uncharacterized protein LOC124925115 [Impatiens glandulifera]|uniref:uncharacterized protein LOC124925115 n=1 Tax=Impatiens glandulifera TaxID=253017 RepID=UPI001FB1628D|nr:uncharacterized protein LOC124925115 [Impatiens glandulifera]